MIEIFIGTSEFGRVDQIEMRWTDSGSACAYVLNEASYYGTRVYVLAAQT